METDRRPSQSGDPYAQADLAVAAQRLFNAALRTAKATRIGHAQAVRVANDFVVRKLGVDWVQELGISAELEELAPAAEGISMTGCTSNVSDFVEALAAGHLAPLQLMPGLTTDWHKAYVGWCRRTGREPVGLKRFRHDLAANHSFYAARKGLRSGGLRDHPKSVLLFGATAPRGRVESEWLAEQVQASQRLFAAAGLAN